MYKLKRLYVSLRPHHLDHMQTLLLLVGWFIIFAGQSAFADTRLLNRSVLVYNTDPSATTKYIFSFTYNTEAVPIGSINLLFCYDPIPQDPCTAPPGLNVANGILSDQTGETGFHVATHTANHILLSRTAQPVGQTPSTYTFDNMVNPSVAGVPFAVRISDYTSTDGTGTPVDLGSVISGVSQSVQIDTQVQPMLFFCVAQQVSQDCADQTGGNYTDMGALSSSHALVATSQMAAGTNASSGYIITVNGPPMEAGTHVIDPLASPTPSAPGNTQFGINLRANSQPNIGNDPDGTYTNAAPTSDYGTPNKFMYHDGDIVASAPHVSLIRRFTVSYLVNVAPNLRAGVYTTTLTYVCSGRF